MIQGFNLKRFCFGLCFPAGSFLGVTAVYTKVGAGKERNKGAALTREELMTAEGIAAVSVHFYQRCIAHPESINSTEMTKALQELIPEDYRKSLSLSETENIGYNGHIL